MIANQFNKYFTFIAKPMVENLVKPKHKCYKYLRNPNTNSFFISPTNSDDLLTVIKELRNNKSRGPSSKFLKLFQITPRKFISLIANLSFSSGSLPNNLKTANVIHIF